MPPACRPIPAPGRPTSSPAATTGSARENCHWESVSRIPMGGLDAKSVVGLDFGKVWTCDNGHLWTLDRWKSYQMEIRWKSVNFCQKIGAIWISPWDFDHVPSESRLAAPQLPPGRLATSATLGITSVTGAAKVAPKPGAMARHGIPLPSFNGHFREFDGEILDVR